MLIDWFTVAAQTLNFIILVWLLKRFLYKPILSALDAREKRIAAELAGAAAKKNEAQEERDAFQRKNAEFDQQRAAMLGKASDEAKAERLRLLEDARNAADALSIKRQSAMQSDAVNLNQVIRHSTQREVFAIARKVLTDLATADLEERVSDVFIHRLRALNIETKESLCKALKAVTEPVIVRSAFGLPATQRADIEKALNEISAVEAHIRYETTPDLVSGIELIASGQKVAWSIADYLASLENNVANLLRAKDNSQKIAEPKLEPVPKSKVKPEGKPAANNPEAKQS